MGKILQESEVSLKALSEHLEDAGWNVDLQQQRLVLHTPRGLGFAIRLDVERHFIDFNTHFPVRKTYSAGLDLVNTLNGDVFLGCFSLDEDNDLLVSYPMSYERGLILAQFARIVRRFGSMIEHVVDHFDKDEEVFAFASEETAPTVTDAEPQMLQ